MNISFADDELYELVKGNCVGKYKKFRSNALLRTNLNKVMRILTASPSFDVIKRHRSLNVEMLTGNLAGKYSLRVGYNTKYRMIFVTENNELQIILIEINEHYGDA